MGSRAREPMEVHESVRHIQSGAVLECGSHVSVALLWFHIKCSTQPVWMLKYGREGKKKGKKEWKEKRKEGAL